LIEEALVVLRDVAPGKTVRDLDKRDLWPSGVGFGGALQGATEKLKKISDFP